MVGEHGRGRTAALATDVAPHWVGGLVDWGDQRVVQDVGGGSIDVGNWYARFFRNLLVWTGRLETEQGRPRMKHEIKHGYTRRHIAERGLILPISCIHCMNSLPPLIRVQSVAKP